MMGSSSGSYKAGGSLSSSSNLSPLAPPFMVDKSFTRSSSTNPSMNFPELPVYGAVFDPAGPYSSGGHKFGATEPLGSTACPPSGGIHGYPGSQSTNSDVYYVGHNAGAEYDPFSYDKFPNGMSHPEVDHVMKPYYGPYVSSPPPCKDACVGLSYDLLSRSGAGHFTGYSSPQVDLTQGVSGGGEYKPKWTGFWGGLGNSEQEKWTEYASGSGVKDVNLSDLSSNKNHLSLDASNQIHPFGDPNNNSCTFGDASSKNHLFGCVSNKSNLKQGACVSQGLDSHGEGSTVSGNTFDMFGGTYHFGSFGIPGKSENLSFKNLGGLSNDGSRVSGFVSVAASIESPGLQRPPLESVTNLSDSQKATGSSSENHFSQTGCYVFGCTSTTGTFPISVTDAQYGGSNSSAGSALSGIQVNSMTANTACSINPSAGQEFLPGVIIRRPQSSSKLGSSSQKGETVNDGLDVKFTSDKTKFTLQVPPQFSSDGFSPKTGDAEASCFIEKHSSGSDVHNPAEDSPCWKGASSTRFSPFSVSESVAAEVFVNQEDECNTSRPEDPQKKNLPVDTSDSVDFSEKVNERTVPKKPAVPTSCTSEDLDHSHSENQKSYCIDLNIPEGLQFLDDCFVSRNDSSLLSKPRSALDSKFSLATEPIVKEGEVSPALDVSQASVAAKGGYCTSAKAHKFPSLPSDDGNDSSCSTLGDKASLNNDQSTKKSPESKFDVNMVLKTMMKLSQMIRCYCLCKPATLTEQCSITLEQIINNLNASMLEMARQTKKTTILSTEELPVSEMVNIAEVAAANKQVGTAQEFLDFSEDDADIIQDDNMTQAIKKILYDNLHEGIDQPEVLYRNLWLEAEAALCVMTAKARFHKMKIEMEKSSQDGMKVENPQSPKVPSDRHGTVDLAPEGKVLPALVCDGESQISSATKHCNDTEEIPIPNSQHLLLNSMKVSRPKESRKELIFPQFLCDSSPFIFGNDSCGLGAASCANDVENSVMARYQILKSRFADSGLKNEGGRSSNEELLTSGVNKHFSETINHTHDVEAPIIARYQILKSRVADNETLSNESKQSSGVENHNLLSLDTSGEEGINMRVNDAKTSVTARYQILKGRMDKSSSLNEGKQSPGGESYLTGGDPSSPYSQFLNPKLFNSIASADDGEASVMARFRIIQNQISGSNSVNKEPVPIQSNRPAAEGGTEGQDWPQQKIGFMSDIFGPYPNFSEDEDVKKVHVNVDGEPLSTSSKINKLTTEILEGWYDNDCSSSDWEHVSKEELRRQS